MIEKFLNQIETLSGKLYRFVLKIVKDKEDALDIVQDTFVRIFQTLKKEQREITDGYYFKTAYNLSVNMLKKSNRKVVDEDYSSSNDINEPLDLILNSEKKKQIELALQQLSEKQKEVIIYRFYTGITLEEIAQLMSISTGSVKVHLARGLANLKKMIPNDERIENELQ